jgi:hypothetical protein
MTRTGSACLRLWPRHARRRFGRPMPAPIKTSKDCLPRIVLRVKNRAWDRPARRLQGHRINDRNATKNGTSAENSDVPCRSSAQPTGSRPRRVTGAVSNRTFVTQRGRAEALVATSPCMNRVRKFLLISGIAVAASIVAGAIFFYRPPDDGRTLAERRQIAEACLTMLHSTLTNEVDDIKSDDPRVPEVIRALNPHHIEVIPNFAVDIYRAEKPREYFLMRLSHPTNTWTLCIAGPSVFPGGGREIFRIEHD